MHRHYLSSSKICEAVDRSIQDAKNIIDVTKCTITLSDPNISGTYWPLFFHPDVIGNCSLDVDCCSTSLGIRCCVALKGDDLSDDDKLNLKSASEILIAMRNSNGSWPSMIQSEPTYRAIEGIINDTVVALHALLDINFLDENPIVRIDSDSDSLSDVTNRINFFIESVNWLVANQVRNGWYFTETAYIENVDSIIPATQPTANTIILLDRTIRKLSTKGYDNVDKYHIVTDRACQLLTQIQQDDGGIGKNSIDNPRLVHTAFAFHALYQHDNKKYEKELFRMHRWLVKNSSPSMLDKLTADDYFDVYDQNIFFGDNKYSYRKIYHESCPIITTIWCLLLAHSIFRKNGLYTNYKISRNIRNMAIIVLNSQVKSGVLRGAFKGKRVMQDEQYPIYYTWNAINPLKELTKKHEMLSLKYLYSINIILTIIVFFATMLAFYIFKTSDIAAILYSVIAAFLYNVINIGVKYLKRLNISN